MEPSYALRAAKQFLSTPGFTSTLTLVIIGVELGSLFLRSLIGWPGLIGMLATLVVIAATSLLAQRDTIEWHGLLPISLLVYAGWAGTSIFWSQYRWATLAGLLYFGGITMLGIYIALTRETIQILRAFGDALRVTLGLSLALEILSGILIDTPLQFLGITGSLAGLGPIQGIFGNRNQLAIVALVATITFGIEFRTRSVDRNLSTASLILAGICLVLARSPLGAGAVTAVAIATVALYAIRRTSTAHRPYWQSGIFVALVAIIGIAWADRSQIISALSANAELTRHLGLWARMRTLIPMHQLEGWGWVGLWRSDVFPFQGYLDSFPPAPTPQSGLNSFLDVWLQLGFIGLLSFVVLVGLALVRSWLLASARRSIVYAWPALILVALLFGALAESSLLVEFGWLLFVVCCVKAARELSWRRAFAETKERP